MALLRTNGSSSFGLKYGAAIPCRAESPIDRYRPALTRWYRTVGAPVNMDAWYKALM